MMKFNGLKLKIKKSEPTLSAEGLMLVELFMPFCEALVKENAELKAKVKSLEDKLAVYSANSSKPLSKDDFKSPKNRLQRKKSGKNPGGSLDNFRKSASRNLKSFMEELRLSITKSAAGFFDETGIKVRGIGHWVHVAATSLFALHPKRGREAHDSMGVLAFFKGLLHRDDYHSYHNSPDALHSLCCAHFLRDLIYAIERNGQEYWAGPLIKLLVKIKEQAERSPNGIVDLRWQGRHRKAYRRLIALGLEGNPLALKKNGSARGRTAQSKTVNLLLRLQDKEGEVLRFMTDERACFDNNQAERDLRMNKVRQKVSGGFRSFQASQEFMDVRSFIATAIKQCADPIEELVHLFTRGDLTHMRLARHPE